MRTTKTLSEQAGTVYMGKNLIGKNPLSDDLLIENQLKKRKKEKEFEELGKKLLTAEQEKQKEIDEKVEKLEMIPLGKKIIIKAYPRNPYRKVVEGSIFVDYQGDFLNPESGEEDRMKELVACAEVIEVGPDCDYLQVGDDIYFDTRSTYPMPFMSLGYLLTTEPQVLSVINEGLKERFKM